MAKFFKALLLCIPIMLTHIFLFYAFIWFKAFEVWAIVLVFFLFELSISALVLEASYEGKRKT
nr:MAG TPA: hypothetical protein [Caudoviricetes sp.]